MTLIIISKKVFHGKNKGGASKHNFSPGMHGWGVFPNSKKYTTQINRNICKTPSKQTAGGRGCSPPDFC